MHVLIKKTCPPCPTFDKVVITRRYDTRIFFSLAASLVARVTQAKSADSNVVTHPSTVTVSFSSRKGPSFSRAKTIAKPGRATPRP